MSLSSTITVIYSVGGVGGQASISKTADGGEPRSVSLAAATQCVANTFVMTDANTAACDLSGGHGLVTDVYDVYWTDGVRYGVTGTVTSNSVALEGGEGDDFPATNTSVTLAAQQEITIPITGNGASVILAHPTVRSHVDFQGSDNTSHWQHDIAANEPLFWCSESGIDNPILGDTVSKVMASTGSTSGGTIKILVLADSTP